MRRTLLLLFLLGASCRTWEVNAFGVPVGKEPRYVMAASDDLTTEEKLGVLLIVGLLVGASVAVALAAK